MQWLCLFFPHILCKCFDIYIYPLSHISLIPYNFYVCFLLLKINILKKFWDHVEKDNLQHTFHGMWFYLLTPILCLHKQRIAWLGNCWVILRYARGEGRLRPRSWKSNKSCLRSLKMSHSFDKLKNDIFIALIIGSVQAAGMTIWVVCVQAVFRCGPGGLRGQQLTHQPAQLCFLCYCLFCYCFSWAIWPTVLVLCYGFFWSSQIICPGSLLLSEDSTLKGNWTLVSLPDRWSHQIIFHFKKVYSHAMLWIYICFYILDHFWWR